MRTMMVVIAMMCGCVAAGESAAVQAVAGPGGVVVTAPVAGQQVVGWTGDAAAWKYYVLQSTAGAVFVPVASVLNPMAAPFSPTPPPPTTWIATGLSGGTSYCYAIEAVYSDGSTSDLGASGCGVATGAPPPSMSGTITVDGSAFRPITAQTSVDYTAGCTFAGGVGVIAPISVPSGGTVTSARFFVHDSPGTVLQAAIRGRDATLATVGNFTSGSSGAGAPQELATTRPLAVDAGRGYFLQVVYFQGTSPGSIAFAEVDYQQ